MFVFHQLFGGTCGVGRRRRWRYWVTCHLQCRRLV